MHVHNQLSGSSLNTDNNSSASYSSTIDLHHKVNINLDNLETSSNLLKKTPRNPGMLQALFKNLRKKSKYCFLTNFTQANQAFMRKVPHGSEADNILVGEVDFLERPISVFLRLQKATMLGDLTEVPVPTRKHYQK